jgi:hypothetical protein
MTLPAILFGLIIALLIGTLYHLARGGRVRRLLMYLGLSVLGFAVGQFAGAWLGWSIFMFGMLNLGMGAVGSILFLATGDWLSRTEGKGEGRV